MEIIVYGRKAGEPDYMEALLASWRSRGDTADKLNVEKVKAVAKKDGFVRFRTAVYNGEKPDFTRIFNRT